MAATYYITQVQLKVGVPYVKNEPFRMVETIPVGFSASHCPGHGREFFISGHELGVPGASL
jgi:hypothetical protein